MAAISYGKAGTPTETHSFTYDGGANGKGKLTQLVDMSGSLAWTYTHHGRVASKTQVAGGVSQTVSYGYNTAGQLTSMVTPSGQQIGYSYVNNRVSAITVNGAPLVAGIFTTPFGPLGAWQWGNGLYTFRDYDTDGRLYRWTFRNGIEVLRNDLAFDAAGRITAIGDPVTPTLSGCSSTMHWIGSRWHSRAIQWRTPSSSATMSWVTAPVRISTAPRLTLSYGGTSNQLQQMLGAVNAGYLNGAGVVDFAYNNANRLTQVQSNGAHGG